MHRYIQCTVYHTTCHYWRYLHYDIQCQQYHRPHADNYHCAGYVTHGDYLSLYICCFAIGPATMIPIATVTVPIPGTGVS